MQEGGAFVRYGNPWATPLGARDALRRLRGRLVLPVTVWATAGEPEPLVATCVPGPDAGATPGAADRGLVGLTVSSVLFAQGDPAMVAGLVSPASELASLVEHPGSRFVVHVLGTSARRLAQHFAGELPASQEMLAVEASTHGPVLSAVRDRVLCTTSAARPFGWSLLIEAVVDGVQVSGAGKPLAWYRGEFRALA